MELEYKLLLDSLYKEIYYLYLWNKLRRGFYQKNGFVVLPIATLNTPAEVVVPFNEALLSEKLAKFYDNAKNVSGEYPTNLSLTGYSNLRPFNPSLFTRSKDNKAVETFISKNKPAIDAVAHFLLPNVTKPIHLEIIPVDFGTVGTFFFAETLEQLTLTFTLRTDLPTSYFVRSLVSSFINFNLNKKKNDYLDSIYWQKRQFLIDYMVNNTAVVKMFPDVAYTHETLKSIKQLEQLASVVELSRDYLKKLNMLVNPDIKLDGEVLHIEGKRVYLTESEKAIFNYLFMHNGHVCTFDELGDVLWKDEEKFSLATIAKFISNIRKKIKEAGVIKEIIYTARGKGVLFMYE